jgi:TonB family protein
MFTSSREFVCLVLQPISSKSCVAGFRFWNDGEMQTQQSGQMFQFDAAQMEQREVTAMPPVAVSSDKSNASADQAEDAASATEPTPSAQGFPRLIPLVGRSYPAANAAGTTWPQLQEFNDRPERRGWGEVYSPRFDDPQIEEVREPKGIWEKEPNPRTTLRFRVSLALLFIAAGAAIASLYELRATGHEARWAAVHLDARRGADGLLLTWDASAPVVAKAAGGLLQVNDGRKATAVQLSQEQLLRGSMTYPDTGANILFSLSLDGGGPKVVTESLRVITSSFIPDKVPAPPAAEVATTPSPGVKSAQGVKSQGVKSAPKMESAFGGSSSGAHTKPAKPVSVRREILPEIPAGIRSRIATQKVVEVQVRIDENGRVTSASSRVEGDGVDQYLADQAVKAARQWLFWPARSTAGEPVSATKTISFEFAPGAY